MADFGVLSPSWNMWLSLYSCSGLPRWSLDPLFNPTAPPVALHRPALAGPDHEQGALSTAGLHGPHGQLVSSDVPPSQAGVTVLDTEVPELLR